MVLITVRPPCCGCMSAARFRTSTCRFLETPARRARIGPRPGGRRAGVSARAEGSQTMEYGSLPDGTKVRRWRPVTPLDQRWRAAMTPKATDLRDRWLARRQELSAANRLDAAIAALVKSWETRGYLPRPVPTEGRPAQSVLLELGFDASVAASLDPEDPEAHEFPSPSARSQAADALLKVIKEDRDLTPADVAKLHGLTCTTLKPTA